jgi:hypothetical protein
MLKQGYAVLLLFLLCCLRIYPADLDAGFSKGPLYGKNMYIPFLIHYNIPSLPARSGRQAEFQYHLSLYYIQDVHYWGDEAPPSGTRIYDKEMVLRDYEGFAGELGFAYNFSGKLQAGIDMRIMAYYGGALDPFFEGFHKIFDFANGSREYFLQNQLYINIPNDNGIPLFLDKETVSFGDIDLWGKWTFFENRRVSLAGLGAFKVPSGRLEALSGSGSPDIGLGLLSDFRVARFLSLYAHAGLVLPFNMKSYPMFNGLAGFEIHPWALVSFNVQMNIKTSPISDSTIPYSWNKEINTDFYQYSMPQTNLLVGFIIKHKGSRFQFYIEEDAITNQGTDMTFNVMFSHSFY